MTPDGKLYCIIETREYDPTYCVIWKLADFDLTVAVDDLKPGDKITLEYCEMTENELKEAITE